MIPTNEMAVMTPAEMENALERLAILEDAEKKKADAEANGLAKEAKAGAEAKRLVTMRPKLEKADVIRLKAVERAEAAARELVVALGDVLKTTAAVGVITREIRDKSPDNLDAGAVARRLSQRIAAEFMGLTGISLRFGQIKFGRSHFQPGHSWVSGERHISNDTNKLLNGASK